MSFRHGAKSLNIGWLGDNCLFVKTAIVSNGKWTLAIRWWALWTAASALLNHTFAIFHIIGSSSGTYTYWSELQLFLIYSYQHPKEIGQKEHRSMNLAIKIKFYLVFIQMIF